MVTENTAKKLLKIYEDAWVNQDVEKILSIFTKDGIYHERVLKKPFKGHKKLQNTGKPKFVKNNQR